MQSELAFAKAASDKGIKNAFLEYLSEDSVLFRPRAVPGKQWTADSPATAGVLIWEPAYVEVSGGGDLGFTTGPYVFRPSKDSPDASYGQFFSIWKKQIDQTWKVFLDAGIESGSEKPKTSLVTFAGKGSTITEEQRTAEQKTILAMDPSFESSLYSTDAIRLIQEDFDGDCAFKPENSGISQSGDLAYVYGSIQCGAKSGIYVRMWRKQDHWKVVLDYRHS